MEIFKDIKGYEGFYQVSNLGRVKSLKRVIDHPKSHTQTIHEKILKYGTDGKYRTAVLWRYGSEYRIAVHRLVALAFILNPKNKPVVNHKDGDKFNNNVHNLEWVTSSENMIHAIKTGLYVHKSGEDHSCSKLKNKDVIEIRSKVLYKTNTVKSLSLEYNVCTDTIYSIINKKSWKHI